MKMKWIMPMIVVLFLLISIPVNGEVWCASNDTATIELFQQCLNETSEPCLNCTVNLTVYRIDDSGDLTVNFSAILNESIRGYYWGLVPNPLVLDKYPMCWVCNDSKNIYGSYDYDILEIMDVCPGEPQYFEELLGLLAIVPRDTAEEVWSRFFILGTPPPMSSTSYYCIDNTTLMKNISFEFCEGGECELIEKTELIFCDYGCKASKCLPNPAEQNLLVIGIIFFAAIIILFLVWMSRRRGMYED